jgi:hypothetical protein
MIAGALVKMVADPPIYSAVSTPPVIVQEDLTLVNGLDGWRPKARLTPGSTNEPPRCE